MFILTQTKKMMWTFCLGVITIQKRAFIMSTLWLPTDSSFFVSLSLHLYLTQAYACFELQIIFERNVIILSSSNQFVFLFVLFLSTREEKKSWLLLVAIGKSRAAPIHLKSITKLLWSFHDSTQKCRLSGDFVYRLSIFQFVFRFFFFFALWFWFVFSFHWISQSILFVRQRAQVLFKNNRKNKKKTKSNVIINGEVSPFNWSWCHAMCARLTNKLFEYTVKLVQSCTKSQRATI